MAEVHNNVICPFCGTLCDDIEVHVEGDIIVDVYNACKTGTSKFLSINKPKRRLKPVLRENGKEKEISFDDAAEIAADVLKKAKKPLIYGLSKTECEAIKLGVELADITNAVIDNQSTVCHGPSALAIHDVGFPSCTLGEVKNRADIVIYWGCNPVHAHPRHMSRYAIFPRGYFRERGEIDRKMIVIDARKTDTASIADKFIRVNSGEDYELVSAIRAKLNGYDIPDKVAGVDKKEIEELVEELKSCQFGILFFGLGLTMSRGKHRNIDNAISLVRDLNRFTKFSIMPMRGHYNVAGFNQVAAWQTGFSYAIDFTRGFPYYNPGETSAVDLLVRKEIDACIAIASDPVANFPRKAVEALAKIPLIAIDPHESPTTELAMLHIPCAVAGIEVSGTAYRMDNVPIRVKKIKEAPQSLPSDREIIAKIIEKVKEKEKLKAKQI